MKSLRYILLSLLATALMAACSPGKYLQPGERVLQGNSMRVEMADSSAVPKEVVAALTGAERYFLQKPNKRMLFTRAKMRLYCSTNPDDTSWWAQMWRRQGEPPVVYDADAANRTADQLATLMRSKGCFHSTATYDTVSYGRHSVRVHYKVAASPRYRIEEVAFHSQQKEINDLLQQWREESLLNVGDYYDQKVLEKERSRIASRLQNEGYYYASTQLVHFMIDTNYNNHRLGVLVSVRQPTVVDGDGKTQTVPLQEYKIDNIYIYPNVSTSANDTRRRFDTLVYPYQTRFGSTDYRFVYDKKISPSPKVISRSMFLFNGQTYRPRMVSNTNNSLLELHNFKYIDIGFEESPRSSDTLRLLDARVRLLNSTRHRLSFSVELTNASSNEKQGDGNFITSGNLGLDHTLGYQNNNLFGGAELLSVEGNLLFELPKNVFSQKDRDFYSTFAAFESGAGVTLDLPDFLLPFGSFIQWQRNKPHTLINLSTDYQFRIFTFDTTDLRLERIRVSGYFGYTWQHSRKVNHKLLPVNISYNHTISGLEYYVYLFLNTGDPRFLYQAENYVLLNTHYEYTYSNQQPGVAQNFNYFHFSVETAGNFINLSNRLFQKDADEQSLLSSDADGVDYYQYLRFDSEFKRYIYLNDKNTLVLRALAGIGIPYGHSSALPYEKMFYGGGPTSMRAWMIRRLGPGQTLTSGYEYPFSVGEMQLVGNLEYRFPIIGIFEGAVFADAGNIWTLNDWGLSEGSQFQPREVLHGVALDAGLGLRLNVSILTLRLDFALPLYDPGYLEGDRWISNHFAWNKIVTNFGINYPF